MFARLHTSHRNTNPAQAGNQIQGDPPMLRYLAAAAAIYALATSAVPSNAAGVDCTAMVSANGISSQVEGSADFERYAGKVPAGLAKRRAIDAWQMTVATKCAGYSSKWWRARAANVECEGTAGHTHCTATAKPARKLMSFLQR